MSDDPAIERRIVEALEAIGVELYRLRVAVEVIAGDVLDRAPIVRERGP